MMLLFNRLRKTQPNEHKIAPLWTANFAIPNNIPVVIAHLSGNSWFVNVTNVVPLAIVNPVLERVCVRVSVCVCEHVYVWVSGRSRLQKVRRSRLKTKGRPKTVANENPVWQTVQSQRKGQEKWRTVSKMVWVNYSYHCLPEEQKIEHLTLNTYTVATITISADPSCLAALTIHCCNSDVLDTIYVWQDLFLMLYTVGESRSWWER